MPTMIVDDVNLTIPEWVTNLTAFRRWTDEPDFPEKGNIWWLRGKVWADMSKQQIFTHLDLKGEIYAVLQGIVKADDLGILLPDGLLLTNLAAGISGNPDAVFISRDSLIAGMIELIEGKDGGFVEARGTPDMVLEVVSDNSVTKDRVILREDYFQAGVTEYWLIDARKKPIEFDIFRRQSKEFVATSKQGGWLKSQVFRRSFRLREVKDRSEISRYELEVK